MRSLALVLLVACAGACGGPQKPPPPPDHDAPAPPAHTVANDTGTLVRLDSGDRACYVVVAMADGKEASLPGDFDLCAGAANDATPLVGKKIRWATRRDKVQAMSCQGNPDCTASDSVDLVITIVPAP